MQKGPVSLLCSVVALTVVLFAAPEDLLADNCMFSTSQHPTCIQRAPDGTLICAEQVEVQVCSCCSTHGVYCSPGSGVQCCNTSYPDTFWGGNCAPGGGGDQPMLLAQDPGFEQVAHRTYVRNCSGGVERLDTAVLEAGIRR